MRVLGVLAAWGVLAVLATLCFAVGGSIGYRRGVQDAVRQLRERRSGKTGCRPLPLPHHRRRPITRIHVSPARSAHAKAAAPPAIHRLRAHFARPNISPALAGAMAAVFLFALPGVALGASAAQPGDSLWPVKRGIEQARLAMATSPDGDMQIHVDLASRRVNELNQLLTSADADPELVDAVIGDLRTHTEAASERLREVDVAQRQQVAERVEEVVHRQVMAIDVLLDIDCTDAAQDTTCVALGDTREVADQLHQATVTVAMAGDDAGTGTQPAAAGGGEEPSEADMVATTERPSGAPAVAAAGTQPAETASPGASEAASEASESPSARPSAGTTPPSTPPDATAAGGAEVPAAGAAAAAKPAGNGAEAVTSGAEEATEAAP
jgi:hypothetical protein